MRTTRRRRAFRSETEQQTAADQNLSLALTRMLAHPFDRVSLSFYLSSFPFDLFPYLFSLIPLFLDSSILPLIPVRSRLPHIQYHTRLALCARALTYPYTCFPLVRKL
jgi:hypothetical protein